MTTNDAYGSNAPADDPMTDDEARALAADWHGGQWSPLYALASTGTVVPGAVREVRECIADREHTAHDTYPLDAERDLARLRALLAYVADREAVTR